MEYNDITSSPISDFNYDLPDSSVAKYPLIKRDQSKLLVWERGEISDHTFSDLPGLLAEGSMLVFNNTRVIRARLHFVKSTGAVIEVFCLEPTVPHDYIHSFAQTSSCRWKCIVGNKKRWKSEVLKMAVKAENHSITLSAELLGELDGGFEVRFSWDNAHFTFSEILEAAGKIPIPPYLHRESEEIDLTVYQTVYSKIKGSVAAPTAGLHFTEKIFKSLVQRKIPCEELTLHVGAGTFQPVKSDTIGDHQMHTEFFSVKRALISQLMRASTGLVVRFCRIPI
jgi:S-adenosylmethionine:tRNA ribosyltransferase-isomerase